ncbi:hypothetical protein [Nocardioides pantholopis]|uniref:hypothetical protein n=1 Tax=Nocardioides pantholopis TaxID=2483798 RepID=UPI000FD9B611|nr:hypothetical protein [Nocardioides pantholopis]
MTEMTREALFGVVRGIWEDRDPVPAGLVDRMRAAVAAVDLDLELMQLAEQPTQLAGTRAAGLRGAGTTYTLRFVHGETDLLLRVAVEGAESRVDGWVVPPEPMTVRALSGGDQPRTLDVVVSDNGRFELTGLPAGLFRLRLEPHADGAPPIATPFFEI